MCRQTQRLEFAATAKGSWKKQGRTFLESLQNEHGPAKTLISGSGLQNNDRIHFCCFKPPGLWCVVTAALDNTETRVMADIFYSLCLRQAHRRLAQWLQQGNPSLSKPVAMNSSLTQPRAGCSL